MSVVSSVGHLARRWAGSLSTRPPAPADAAWAEAFLPAGETALWRRLSNVDRRHAILVARRYAELRPDAARAEMAGALLHDIGKLDAGLGTWMRVVATVVGPRTERFRRYHDHEAIGAEMLVQAGSDPLTVAMVADSADLPPSVRAALHTADDI
jgi:hypothetical protein